MVVLSKRLLVERLFGWLPIFDVIEGLKVAKRAKDAKRAKGWLAKLCEADATESLRSLAGSRLYGQEAIQAAYGTDDHQNADAVVEYPDAFVIVEIETHQLKRETVVGGKPDALESDLRTGIVEKAEQLQSTISDLVANETALTGRVPVPRRRYIAVLVLTEGFPVNPMTMSAARSRLEKSGLLTDEKVGPLHVLSQEELDIAEAICEETGETFLDLLEAHERSSMREMHFKNWVLTDVNRRNPPNRPTRLESARDAFWSIAVERLRRETDRDAGDLG